MLLLPSATSLKMLHTGPSPRSGKGPVCFGGRLSPKEQAIVRFHNQRFLNQLLNIQKQYPKVLHQLRLPQLGRLLGRFAHAVKKSPNHSLILSIMGATASGKTTIATELYKQLQKDESPFKATTPLISQDNFFKDDSGLRNALRKQFGREQGDARFFEQKNLDMPDALEKETFAKMLGQVKAGNEVRMPQHSFADSSSKPDAIPVKPGWITLIEGLFPLKLAKKQDFDLTLFVKMNEAMRKNRWTKRAREERGVTHPDALKAHWRKTEAGRIEHIAPAEKEAMIVFNNSGSRNEANPVIAALALGLRKHLIPIRRIFGK